MAWAVWSARVVGIGSKSEGDICSKKKRVKGIARLTPPLMETPPRHREGFFLLRCTATRVPFITQVHFLTNSVTILLNIVPAIPFLTDPASGQS